MNKPIKGISMRKVTKVSFRSPVQISSYDMPYCDKCKSAINVRYNMAAPFYGGKCKCTYWEAISQIDILRKMGKKQIKFFKRYLGELGD
jgi:hypothetical protein